MTMPEPFIICFSDEFSQDLARAILPTNKYTKYVAWPDLAVQTWATISSADQGRAGNINERSGPAAESAVEARPCMDARVPGGGATRRCRPHAAGFFKGSQKFHIVYKISCCFNGIPI